MHFKNLITCVSLKVCVRCSAPTMQMCKMKTYFFTFLIIILSAAVKNSFGNDNVITLIKTSGYPAEIHTVETSDGYLLTLHRIPSSQRLHQQSDDNRQSSSSSSSSSSTNNMRNHKPSVLLMHGMICSSADYLVSGPGHAIGYVMADAGYDVWLGNVRGTTYSKQHRILTTDQPQFWDFSWHEIGEFDVPAIIDYILGVTNRTALHYVGHSQGTTIFFVMLSIKPQYNKKIITMTAMSPIVYVKNVNPMVRVLVANLEQLEVALKIMEMYELMPFNLQIHSLAKLFCSPNVTTASLCKNLIFSVVGTSPHQFNGTLLPLVFAYTPAGISYRQLLHFIQIVKFNRFQQYDFKRDKNLRIYGMESPPKYDLSRIHVPIYIFYGTNDLLGTKANTLKFIVKISKNHIPIKVQELVGWNHIDFTYAIDAKQMIYNKILKYYQNYN